MAPSQSMAETDLAYFRSIPWCATILNDSQRVIIPTNSRFPKENTEDAFFGETLKTNRTISACVSLYKAPSSPDARIEEVMTLLSLGPGFNGYPHVAHGGMIATVLDELMGISLCAKKDQAEHLTRSGRTNVAGSSPTGERMATVTAELVIKYLKTLATPQTVCVKAWVAKSEGRKLWLVAVIEDEKSTVLATEKTLFVRIRKEKL